jgi:hypothetical protein
MLLQVWEQPGSGYLRWEASDVGAPHMGAVVENSAILLACQHVALKSQNVQFYGQCRVESVLCLE